MCIRKQFTELRRSSIYVILYNILKIIFVKITSSLTWKITKSREASISWWWIQVFQHSNAARKNDFYHWPWVLPDVSSCNDKARSFMSEKMSARYPGLNMFSQHMSVRCSFKSRWLFHEEQLVQLQTITWALFLVATVMPQWAAEVLWGGWTVSSYRIFKRPVRIKV